MKPCIPSWEFNSWKFESHKTVNSTIVFVKMRDCLCSNDKTISTEVNFLQGEPLWWNILRNPNEKVSKFSFRKFCGGGKQTSRQKDNTSFQFLDFYLLANPITFSTINFLGTTFKQGLNNSLNTYTKKRFLSFDSAEWEYLSQGKTIVLRNLKKTRLRKQYSRPTLSWVDGEIFYFSIKWTKNKAFPDCIH